MYIPGRTNPERQAKDRLLKTIFAVFGVAKPDLLAPVIQQLYSADSFNVGPGQWLVADSGTAKEVSDKLGITSGETLGAAIVVSVAGYFGRYQANLWEWIAAEMRATPNG